MIIKKNVTFKIQLTKKKKKSKYLFVKVVLNKIEYTKHKLKKRSKKENKKEIEILHNK